MIDEIFNEYEERRFNSLRDLVCCLLDMGFSRGEAEEVAELVSRSYGVSRRPLFRSLKKKALKYGASDNQIKALDEFLTDYLSNK